MFLVGDGHTNMRAANALQGDQHPFDISLFDYVITNPPYGTGTKRADTSSLATVRTEIAFLCRVRQLLKVGGHACVIQPDGVLENPSFAPFRREFLADIPHMPSKFVEFVPLSHRQGNCIPYAAIRWHDFGNRPALGRPLGHFSRHPDTPLLSLSPRRRFPRPTPERVFVADHQSSSGFSGTGPSAPPPQPIGT